MCGIDIAEQHDAPSGTQQLATLGENALVKVHLEECSMYALAGIGEVHIDQDE